MTANGVVTVAYRKLPIFLGVACCPGKGYASRQGLKFYLISKTYQESYAAPIKILFGLEACLLRKKQWTKSGPFWTGRCWVRRHMVPMVRTQWEPSTTSDIDIIDVSLSLPYQKLHGCGPHDAQNGLMKACFPVNFGALCAMKPFQECRSRKGPNCWVLCGNWCEWRLGRTMKNGSR